MLYAVLFFVVAALCAWGVLVCLGELIEALLDH